MPSDDLYDRTLSTDTIYHIFNRGVAKQPLFQDERDYQHLLLCLSYYLEESPSSRLSHVLRTRKTREQLQQPIQAPLVTVHAYALMPNHFHLVVGQQRDNGISTWLRRALNSYSRYYNVRRHRVGPMFQGPFRFVRIGGDDQFLHITRYTHLNPVVAKLSANARSYQWSSMDTILSGAPTRLCDPALTLSMIGSPERYEEFVNDHAGYASSIAHYQHLLHDELD